MVCLWEGARSGFPERRGDAGRVGEVGVGRRGSDGPDGLRGE